MSDYTVAQDQQNVSVTLLVLDEADGTPYTGMTAATSGHVIWYQRGHDNAEVTDGGSAADHGAIGDAHTDWEFIHIGNGRYRVDFPDAAFASGESYVEVGMGATGYSSVKCVVEISPFIKFQGSPEAVTATTTTFPSGLSVQRGDTIVVTKGTGIGQHMMVESVSGLVATHAAWPDTDISATTSTIALVVGSGETDAYGGIRMDAAITSRATPAQVNTECDTAIADAALATADGMLGYFKVALRDDAAVATDRASEITSINSDEGAGAGAFANTTDSQEAIAAGTFTDPTLVYSGTIDNIVSQTVWEVTPTNASSDNDAYNGCLVIIRDSVTNGQISVHTISDYIGSSNRITLFESPKFTLATGDAVEIYAAQPVIPFVNSLATAERTSIAQSVWSLDLGNSNISASAMVQIIAGAAAGKLSGSGTTTITIRSIEDDANIIVATVDANGNRSAVTLTVPGDF